MSQPTDNLGHKCDRDCLLWVWDVGYAQITVVYAYRQVCAVWRQTCHQSSTLWCAGTQAVRVEKHERVLVLWRYGTQYG